MHVSMVDIINQIKYAIADDHRLFREGLVVLLEQYDELRLVQSVSDGKEMIQYLERAPEHPDICILDLCMENMDGYDTAASIKNRWPDIDILILTNYPFKINMIRLFQIGINGFMAKNSAPAEIYKAMTAIKKYRVYVSEVHKKILLESRDMLHMKMPVLSATEIYFLKLCCSELTYKEIANKMKTTTGSIAGFRNRLFEKLNVNSRTGLVTIAFAMGLVSPEYLIQ
jgi:two-component system invasion response regulator UvrY